MIRLLPYLLAHISQDFLHEEISTLLEQRIIEPSKSSWDPPIVLVPKRDGSKRICVNYRKINAITTGDPYPIPHIEELISNIGRAMFISMLDLMKGYYQVLMEQSSKEKTGFITLYGKYHFVTMPFGLVSATSTFKRLLDQGLQGLHHFALAYLDDILIHSVSWENHIQYLTLVLES